VPLIVASPVFLQNIDSSAMMIALPSIAGSLGVETLHLNLVITAYLLSLAVFLPLSAWLAERFGARQMFCVAIALFSFASALCGAAGSMTTLIVFRVLQGMGAAMMVPVGRLILLRTVEPSQLIGAMVWYTVPPTIGRLTGPLVGGAIVSVLRTNIVGAIPMRLALFGVPFLLPLLMQLGFDLPPLTSGLLSAAGALGALCTRGVMRFAFHRYGFRQLLLVTNVLMGLCYASYALFNPSTSHLLMFAAVFAGGLLSSLCTVLLNTMGFVDVPKAQTSHATALLSMTQQLTAGLGVLACASLLRFFAWIRGGGGIAAQDFSATFLVVGAMSTLSLFSFARLTSKEEDSAY
jgi:MFS family permease